MKEKVIDLTVPAYKEIMIDAFIKSQYNTFRINEATTEILSVCNEKTRKVEGGLGVQ